MNDNLSCIPLGRTESSRRFLDLDHLHRSRGRLIDEELNYSRDEIWRFFVYKFALNSAEPCWCGVGLGTLSIPQIGVMAYQFNNNHSGEQRNSTPRSLQMKPDR